MNNRSTAVMQRIQPSKTRQLRLALVCDLLEENWPSMDLVADMLYAQLVNNHGSDVDVQRLRPTMRRRFELIRGVGGRKLMHNADRFVNRFADYPRWLRKRAGQFDLFHVIDHSYAQLVHELPAQRTIVTCHDLDAFRCLLEPEGNPRPLWFRAFARRILDGFLRAGHIVCVSSAVRDELLMHKLVPPERLWTVHWGIDPSFSPQSDPSSDEALTRLLPRWEQGPLLLNVGIPIPRKRLDILLKVFAQVRKRIPNARLIRVGGPFPAAHEVLIRQLGLESAIDTLPFLERPVLAAVYRRATLLLQTSAAEGFCLPLIEALSCGCPVIATDLPVLREVGAAAVEFCPLANVPAWSETVIRILQEREENAQAWEMRRQKGLLRARKFTWDACAHHMIDIYREVYNGN